MKIAYDGTDFAGYQVQRDDRTVQGVVEDALERLHGHPVRVTGSGRTDSGVHADGQYVSFESDHTSITEEKWVPAINSLLPHDVAALDAKIVRDGFSARYDAVRRHYRYYLSETAVELPSRRRYSVRVPQLDLEAVAGDAASLVGTHDFATFAAANHNEKSTVRTIFYADVARRGNMVTFAIGGNGFLWRMVRSIVGTLLDREAARRRSDGALSSMADYLERPDRSSAGATAPARGLFLHDVEFRW